MNFLNKSLLVTGGAGFIASNFVHYWIKKYPKDKVIILDSLSYAANLDSIKEKIEKAKKDQEQSLSKGDFHEIILYNDDVNTFDHVIDVLIKVCDHTATQAEQCALIVHYKGKCSVKSGTLFDLKPKVKKMIEERLTAEII